MSHIPKPLVDLLNKADEGFTPFAFGMSVRALRVVRDSQWLRFRVEHLTITDQNPHNPRGTWHTMSSHTGKTPGEMLGSAMDRLMLEQKNMLAKLARRGLA